MVQISPRHAATIITAAALLALTAFAIAAEQTKPLRLADFADGTETGKRGHKPVAF